VILKQLHHEPNPDWKISIIILNHYALTLFESPLKMNFRRRKYFWACFWLNLLKKQTNVLSTASISVDQVYHP